MRKQSWIVVSVMLAAVAPWACSQTVGPLTGTGTGGSTSGSVGSTGTGGLDCTGILKQGACDDCLRASCCQTYADCAADTSCDNCLFQGSTDAVCMDAATTALSAPFLSCAQASCSSECFPPPPPDPACDAPAVSPSMGSCYTDPGCNPVTNAGCQPGEACDGNDKGGFQCFGSPANTALICGDCDDANIACACGGTCGGVNNQCIKFCCDDGDCGSGKCVKGGTTNSRDVGVCIVSPGIDGGTDAGSDAGDDAGDDAGSDAGDDAGADAGSDAGDDAAVDDAGDGGDGGP
jgi:hypothetical protein